MRRLLVPLARSLALVATLVVALASAGARGASGDESKPPYSVRDTGAARNALDDAKTRLAAGETSLAMISLQRVFDRHATDVVLVEEDPSQARWISAPEAAMRVLDAATPEQRRAYEAVSGPVAAAALRDATANRDEAGLLAVLSRFAATAAGTEAARRLAEIEIEAGRPYDAAGAAARGLRFASTDAGLWLRRVEALEAAQDADGLAAVALPRSLERVRTGSGEVDVAARLAAARASVPAERPLVGWPAFGGPPDHDRPFPTEPSLRPRRYGIGDPVRSRRNDEGSPISQEDDGRQQFERRRATWYPFFPALADRTLYVADGTSVSAHDLYSGREAWSFPGTSHVPPGLPVVGPLGDDESFALALRGRTNLDVAFAPAVSNGVVYATVEVESPYSEQRLQAIEITTYRPRRVLVALDAKTGALRWYAGQHPDDREALSGFGAAGPPVVADGLVVILCARQARRWMVSAMAFDAATGRLRWSRDLVSGQQELNLFGEPVKELYAGIPAVKDGVVYASTGLGVLAALDLRTGDVVWMSSYDPLPVQRVELWYVTPIRYALWGPTPPIVHGDVVLAAPSDGTQLLCLDRASGTLRWRQDAESDREGASDFVGQVLGVASDGTRDVVVTSGRGVRALDLKTGKLAWEGRLEDRDDVPRGRGAMTPTTVVLSTQQGLARFSIRGEGRYLGLAPWPDPADPGNVLPFPEVLVVAGRGRTESGTTGPIQGFFAWEDLEKALAARRAEHPGDAGVLVESADVWRVVGDDARAEDLYKEAARLAESRGDVPASARAKQGLHRLYLERARRLFGADKASEAKGAIAQALAQASSPAETASARMLLDDVLEAEGPTGIAARGENLEALVRDAGDVVAVFPRVAPLPVTLPVRVGGRLRLAAARAAAGRPADAIDALQAILENDGDVLVGDEPARARVRRDIDEVIAVSGRDAYAKHEAAAQAALGDAAKEGDAAAFRRVLERWPNAGSVPAALLGLADREASEGKSGEAASTLRRFLSAYPDHARVAEALARLSRALAAAGARDAARAALAALERRHATMSFTLDGKTFTGASFAAAERASIPPPVTPPAERAFEPPIEEAMLVEVDPGAGRGFPRCLAVGHAREGPVPAPVLVDVSGETWAVDPVKAQVAWKFTPPTNAGREPRVTLAVLAGDVLVLGSLDLLTAVDPATGAVRWSRPVSGAPRALDAAQGQVLVLLQDPGPTVRSRLVSIDAITSDVLWTREMPMEAAEALLVGEDAAVVVRRRRGIAGLACSIDSLLSGAEVKELSFGGAGDRLDPILRLADSKTLIVGQRDAGATRIDAYDLPSGTSRWTRSLADPQGRVLHLVPSGDVIVAIDASGGIRDVSVADGTVVHETKIVGGVDLVGGTQPLVDAQRLILMQKDGVNASLEGYDRMTGRAVWRIPLAARANGGLLLRGGDVVVALIAPRRTVTRLGASTPEPGPLQAWFVHAGDGSSIGELSSPALGSWIPSAVLSDGGLVVAGVAAVAVYR